MLDIISLRWRQGVGVGDGLTDPFVQVTSYDEFSYSAGLIDQPTRDTLLGWELQAQMAILNGNFSGAANLFDQITGTIIGIAGSDVYNYREYTGNGPAPADPTAIWLNYSTTIAALNVDPAVAVNFQDCNNQMYTNFANDIGQSYMSNYSYLLTQTVYPVNVMLYNGQDDIICNTPGSLTWINQMDWPGVDEFREATRNIWYAVNGSVLGEYKQYENFTFVEVDAAGHMVPLDQPASARDMVNRFINNAW